MTNPVNAEKKFSVPQIPKGYSKRSTDIVGFWLPEEGPIHCIPRGVKLFDNKQDKKKPSCLIIVELVDSCVCSNSEDDDTTITVPAGSVVGVWAKAGMRAIKDCGNMKVFMFLTGEKDVGKKEPMKTFEVTASSTIASPIPILEDTRQASAREPTMFDAKGSPPPF